jgi:hypothetical protein
MAFISFQYTTKMITTFYTIHIIYYLYFNYVTMLQFIFCIFKVNNATATIGTWRQPSPSIGFVDTFRKIGEGNQTDKQIHRVASAANTYQYTYQ